jgi:ankyrin repeat protein
LYAVRFGSLEIVEMLMKYEEKQLLLNQTLEDGRNALLLAIQNRNLQMIDFLLENNIPEVSSCQGITPAMYAIQENLSELAKEFFVKGHDMFAKDCNGNDIFVHAIFQKKMIFIEYLIENGFSPNIEYSGDWTALTFALKSCARIVILSMTNLSTSVKSQYFGPYPFAYLNIANIPQIRNCIFQNQSVNFSNFSPIPFEEKLSVCVIHNRLDLLKTLISDSDYTGVNFKGNNILAQSIQSYQMNIFDFIIKNLNWKEMINIRNNEGLLPIHIALKKSNYHVVRTFCDLSVTPVNIDRMCCVKTIIHKGLFDKLKQWRLLKTIESSDVSFHFQ